MIARIRNVMGYWRRRREALVLDEARKLATLRLQQYLADRAIGALPYVFAIEDEASESVPVFLHGTLQGWSSQDRRLHS